MDWYVDSSAVGTLSAQAPADAHIDVFSFFAADSMQIGDRIWVAKRYFKDAPHSANLYKLTTRGKDDAGKVQLIGWPNSGDPFYQARPAAGISAGWDAHTQASSFGQGDMFTLTNSSGASGGIDVREGQGHYNICFVDSSASATSKWGMNIGVDDGIDFDNMFFVGRAPKGESMYGFGRVRLVYHSAVNRPIINPVAIREFEVMSQSVISSLLDEDTAARLDIGRLIISTSSLNYLFERTAATTNKPTSDKIIDSIRGNKPNLGDVEPNATREDSPIGIMVGDYYGEGPKIMSTLGETVVRVGTVSELAYSASQATLLTGSGSTTQDGYGQENVALIAVRVFSPNSGDSFSVEWPVLTNQSSIQNPNLRLPHFSTMYGNSAPNFTEISSQNIAAGSLDNWSGSLKTANSSAFILVGSFTAVNDGDVAIGLYLPPPLQGAGQVSIHSGYFGVANVF